MPIACLSQDIRQSFQVLLINLIKSVFNGTINIYYCHHLPKSQHNHTSLCISLLTFPSFITGTTTSLRESPSHAI